MTSPALEPSSAAWLIRHGESVANAGGPVTSFSQIALTPRGHQQAELFAARFHELSPDPPTLIVLSPYLRARQTAEPFLRRFPQVPSEVWPVQEFTYLDPVATHGLNDTERDPFYADYWGRNDPDYRAADSAESFTAFLDRVRDTLRRLSAHPCGRRVAIFTHGYFMQAVRLLLLFPELTDQSMMSASRRLNDAEPIANTEVLELRLAAGKVTALAQEHITTRTFEPIHPTP